MKLRDVANRVIIDPRKLIEYALNPANERGQHKARVFEQALGYTLQNYDLLVQQLQDMTLDQEAKLVRVDRYGQHLQVDLEITGAQGQRATVRTGWLVPTQARTAWLVTLYVKR